MTNTLGVLGTIAGAVGALVCLIAGLTRIVGSFYLFSYEAMTLFTGGIALMVAGCFLKLQQLTRAEK